MSIRTIFVIAAAIAALGVATGAAIAQTPQQKAVVDAAKTQGIVGEQADGLLGFRTPSSDPALTQAVQAINTARRSAYARSAADAGATSVELQAVGARAFETIIYPRITSGQWYRNAQGQWVQR